MTEDLSRQGFAVIVSVTESLQNLYDETVDLTLYRWGVSALAQVEAHVAQKGIGPHYWHIASIEPSTDMLGSSL